MTDRLPTVNGDRNSWGAILNQFLADNMPWDVPENFGTIGQGNDGAIINAAIQSFQATGKPRLLRIPNRYTLEQTIVVNSGPPVHFWFDNGAMNRQNGTVPTFVGGRFNPATSFGGVLLQIGVTGNQATNPNGTILFNPTMNGRDPSGTSPAGSVGIAAEDTSDIVVYRPQMANFDPTGAGVAIFNQGSASVAAAGMDIVDGVIQNCGSGLIIDGIGATDYRILGMLFRLCGVGVAAGPSTSGGGGMQMEACHFVNGSAGGTGRAVTLGNGAADSNMIGNYFDTYGTADPVVDIVPRNVSMQGNHFLASGNAPGIMVNYHPSTSRLMFRGNWCDANGSAMTALLRMSGKAGVPSAGVIDGNFVYNHTVSLIACAIDSANVALPATSTGTTYIQGNVAE